MMFTIRRDSYEDNGRLTKEGYYHHKGEITPYVIKATNDSESYTLTLKHDKCPNVKILYYQQCTKYTEPTPMWSSYKTLKMELPVSQIEPEMGQT